MIRDEYIRRNGIGGLTWVDGRCRARTVRDPETRVTLHAVGYGTGDRWHTDHIIPVHKGGRGIDPNNLQVLCVPCHLAKTKEDYQCSK